MCTLSKTNFDLKLAKIKNIESGQKSGSYIKWIQYAMTFMFVLLMIMFLLSHHHFFFVNYSKV